MTVVKDARSKLEDLLGKDTVTELEALSPADLNKRIADAASAIAQAKQELEATPAYQEAVENKKALSSGFNELKKRQNAVIRYCVDLRNQE